VRGLPALEISRAREQHAPGGREPAHDQARIGRQRADAQREIVALLDEVDVAVGELQIEPHQGMRGEELRHERGDQGLAGSGCGADAKRSPQ